MQPRGEKKEFCLQLKQKIYIQGEAYPILRVEAGVDDPVHVKVEIIVLEPVRVRLGGIDRDLHAINLDLLLLHHIHHHHGILLRQPAVERRDSHCAASLTLSSRSTETLIQGSKERVIEGGERGCNPNLGC